MAGTACIVKAMAQFIYGLLTKILTPPFIGYMASSDVLVPPPPAHPIGKKQLMVNATVKINYYRSLIV